MNEETIRSRPARPWQHWRTALAVLVAVALPVVGGLLSGDLAPGLAIGMGAALISAAPGGERGRRDFAFGPLPAAMFASIAAAWTPWPIAATLALVAASALLSGYSRAVGEYAVRFVVYLVLATTMIRSSPHHSPWGAGLFALGGLWALGVQRLLGVRAAKPVSDVPGARLVPMRRRLRHTLTSFASRQFAARLVFGLAVGWGIATAWPGRHWDWIALTVAILTRRAIERLPVRTIERVAGTSLGVGLAWLLARVAGPSVLHAGAVVLLAMAVGPARRRSYFAYSVLATPLILAAVDRGPAHGNAVLLERLIATVAGGAIVVAGNLLAAAAERRWSKPTRVS